LTLRNIYSVLTVVIAAVWLVNGLFCKVFDMVPRHEAIVLRVLDTSYSRPLTVIIGFSEVVMAVWVLTRYKPKWSAITQIVVVSLMNILEFFFASDLLLWGKGNAFFALLFIGVVYYHGFVLPRKVNRPLEV
jgi:hypothetical protein